MSTYQTSTPIQVLIVDDEPAIRRALRASLTELGFIIEEASRGEDAIQLVQTKLYDAVLLDINMPGMGGIKTLLKLRAMFPRTADPDAHRAGQRGEQD